MRPPRSCRRKRAKRLRRRAYSRSRSEGGWSAAIFPAQASVVRRMLAATGEPARIAKCKANLRAKAVRTNGALRKAIGHIRYFSSQTNAHSTSPQPGVDSVEREMV
jgi:hypothetical protein